jgi:hypothetical protein
MVKFPGVSFHIDKMNDFFFFQKWIPLFEIEIIQFSIVYYDIVTWIVKLFRV